ncbi:MAG: hypothetical protein KUL79_01920 [Thauera sp.]|nr:hypothetical protein [Thauera sp.]
MQKTSLFAGMLALAAAALPGQVFAACSGSSMNQTQLGNVFPGKTVCAQRGSERWQEFHGGGGALIDYKMGPGDAVDPSKQVGTWVIQGTGSAARMVYDYGSGGRYEYRVYEDNGRYSFCNGNEVHDATVIEGQSRCAF